MCGIAGFLTDTTRGDRAGEALRSMTDALTHRGPDDSGYWVDAIAGVGIGQRRLSIIDLSPAGHQPMTSPSGRYITVLNGEIYNYRDLRAELAGHHIKYRGDSDTEVALAAFDTWGVEAGTRKLAGMFAFAVWDTVKRELYLIRDRVGEKPLYYARMSGAVLFGSELKALQRHPSWVGDINRSTVAAFLRHSFIPGDGSVYERTGKVPPGTMLRFSDANRAPELIRFWSPREAAESGRASLLPDDATLVANELDTALRRTVRQEMLADVPLGAFLSGGIDSSLIVALMQAESTRPVRTYTIGFEDPRFNEAQHAREVAAYLGTEHTEFVVTDQDALDTVPRLATLYDEPFADSSQMPTHLVAALARRRVTVALTGDGGDELFAGYGRYPEAVRLWTLIKRMPAPVRAAVSLGIRSVPDALLNFGSKAFGWAGPIARAKPSPERVAKLARVVGARDAAALYREMMTQWDNASSVVRGAKADDGSERRETLGGPNVTMVEHLMFSDLTGYLCDDILVKVDRASMGVSLESRAPFLDHRIVELAWRIPVGLKLRDGVGKWILRELLNRYVPRKLTDRPKMGFGVPLDSWLRGPLKAMADDLLSADRLKRQGIFDVNAISALWQQYRAGGQISGHLVWSLVMFQMWHDAMVGPHSQHLGGPTPSRPA